MGIGKVLRDIGVQQDYVGALTITSGIRISAGFAEIVLGKYVVTLNFANRF
ncbi:MAG TPA: hypothetical protein VES88_11350 [Gemmatimonadaceae bacterium]|nr:hypothetical protein [Gemmatimonadaceae bacterium]